MRRAEAEMESRTAGNETDFLEIRTRELARQRTRFGERLGAELALVPGGGGYRIKETETHFIDVMEMAFNWRITETRKDCEGIYDRSWCYQGTGINGFIPAALAALAWDGTAGTEPAGYLRRAT